MKTGLAIASVVLGTSMPAILAQQGAGSGPAPSPAANPPRLPLEQRIGQTVEALAEADAAGHRVVQIDRRLAGERRLHLGQHAEIARIAPRRPYMVARVV